MLASAKVKGVIIINENKPRVSRHNGRAGKNGVYNPKHNDRSFDVANADNIHPERTPYNLYWDERNGLRTHAEQSTGRYPTFSEIEHQFYEERYGAYIAGQCARNIKSGHARRNRSIDDLLQDKRTCPEETIYQIGKDGECPPPELLTAIVQKFMAEMNARYGAHIHILDWALHLDETSPHIHARQVYDVENPYGEIEPKQEKALEAIGIPLPQPDKKPSKFNNRKITFDADCRGLLLEICQKHGLEVEEEAIYGGKAWQEKNDYILAAQRQKLAETQAELTEKQARLDDVDALIDSVSAVAYSEAVKVMSNAVTREVQQEQRSVLNEMIAQAESPQSTLRKSEQFAVVTWLKAVRHKLKSRTQQLVDRVVSALDQPAVRKAGMEKIREAARPSVMEMLIRFKTEPHPTKPPRDISAER